MTNQEKLAAVRVGRPGSYNFSPGNRSLYGRPTFQALAREAHEIAIDRGYFNKPSPSSAPREAYQALLVNIPSPDGPALDLEDRAADRPPPSEPGR